ncbi:hypothetical protein M758_5G048400 [Ceratodon purpureus]|nr:hypothetical protein M758_5G048400 [Ceratodon purpureus]
MRPAQPTMYGQPTYVVPQNAVQYYAAPNCPPGGAPVVVQQQQQQQYGRNPQEMAQPSQQMGMQPVYLVQQHPQQPPVMHQYSAVVGVPTQVVGSPVPQAMVGIQGVPAYGAAQGWYRPAMVEPQVSAPVWGYGADRPRVYGEQEPRVASNWQRAPPQGYGGNGGGGAGASGGFQGRVEGHGNGVGGAGAAGGFQGRVEGHGNGAGGFQGRGEAHGNGFQGRGEAHGNGFQGRGEAHGNGFQGRGEAHGNVQSFGKTGGDGRRSDRGFESGSGSRHYSSGTPGRQHMNRHGAPPQSPSPSPAKQLSCEACEKNFAVPSQYTAHMNTHVPCDEIGCSFSASECEFLWSVLNVQSVNGCWSCAGKVVKEHKLTSHSKSSNLNPMSALKAASRLSEESNDEIKAWREERKRNYPTRLNIQRKKEILEGKVSRGELIEEDARKRRQRMKEILAKQAELGVPVAEVPSYYLSQPHRDDRARGRGKQMPAAGDGPSGSMNAADSRKRKIGEDAGTTTSIGEHSSKSARMDTDLAELPTKSQYENPEGKVVAQPDDRDEAGTSQPSDKPAKTQCYFYQRGRCRKGIKCHFAHTRGKKGGEGEAGQRGKKGAAAAAAAALEKKRSPTLLSKLLQADITRDKSHILQCLRFFVNNNFLLDGILQPFESTELPLESDAALDSSDYSEGEVVEAPDMLLADTAIINTLLSERPEVLAKVIEMETQA